MAPDSAFPARPESVAERPIPDRETYRRGRAGGDLYGRSLLGPLFYLVGCVVTAWVAGFLWPLRLVSWLPSGLYLALFFLRRLNRPPDDPSDVARFARWRRRHWALIHSGCLLWAAVFVDVVWEEGARRLPLTVAVIIGVAFGAALSQAFAMESRQTTLTLSLLYGPCLALLFAVTPLRPIGVVLAVYLMYLLLSMRRLAREYEAQIDTEYALILSRTEVEKLTRLDMLTGLANRREYEHAYPRAWHQATRQRTDLALIVLDIDHFKVLNDRHGHLAGDACLQHFAGLLRKHFRREVDLLARIGGEEFVVVLPGSSTDEAVAMAERFREELESSRCQFEGQDLAVTVSAGVASADPGADTRPDGTFARTDLACYAAKTQGRNRVVVAGREAR